MSATAKLGDSGKLLTKCRPQHASMNHPLSGFATPGTTMRVSQFLADHHISFEEVVHAPAFTAQKLAKSLHVSGRHVMKSVLLKCSRGFVVAVLPAAEQIDLARLNATLGGSVRLAT